MRLETVEYSAVIARGIEPARVIVVDTAMHQIASRAVMPDGTVTYVRNTPVELFRRTAGYQCAGSMARIHTEEYGFRFRMKDGTTISRTFRTPEEARLAFLEATADPGE